MDDATRKEAVDMLRRMRKQAQQSGRVRRPILRRPPGVGLLRWTQNSARQAAAGALVETRYYHDGNRAGWVAAIDRAIASLALGGAA